MFASDTGCELRARRLLAYGLSQTNRLSQAIWEAEKAHRLAQRNGTPRERYQTAVTVARLRLSGLADLGRVERLLSEIEPLAAAAEPSDRLYAESTRAGVLNLLGFFHRAAVAYARVRDLAVVQGNLTMAASEEFNRIDALARSGALASSESQRGAATTALNRLASDEQTPVSTRLRALALLAQLDPDRAPRHLGRCVEVATAVDRPRSVARCASELATAILEGAPAEGLSAAELIEVARDAAARSGNPNAELQVSRARMALLWQSQPAAIALDQSLGLLATEAARRQRQATPARRLEFLAFLNQDHYWLAGKTAAAVTAGLLPAEDLEQALQLLESVRRLGVRPPETLEPVSAQLGAWERASQAARGSGDPLLDASARAKIGAAESMPASWIRPVPRPESPASGPDFAAVRGELDPDQAIVYFQSQPQAGAGGHWVYLLAASETRVHPISNPGAVELGLALLNSGVRLRRADAFDQALEKLYAALLPPVLAASPDIQRLVVIPDAAVHAVPMHALTRLDSRVTEIEVWPSIGAWLDRDRRRRLDGSVRIFADPELPPSATAPPRSERTLSRLPGAEREAAALGVLLGSRAELARGAQATETRALAALSSSAGVVHFATHAVLNSANPNVSAVVLAADDKNDGWLTLAQVATLDIPPKLIVLSACEAASGRTLTGEGLIGLSSGFLGAGAHAVLANLWPVDDAHAAVFIERLYSLLDRGNTLAQALGLAADGLARAGYPAIAWAGWTVIGDGDSVLTDPPRRWRWPLALGVGLLALAAGAALRGRRDRRTG